MKIKTKLVFLLAILIVVDQISKYLLSNFFCNKNTAWDIPVHAGIFYFVWIAIIAGLIYMFLKSKIFYQKVFLTMIFSGAFSNMIDRIRLGCVVDYIDLKFWPVFNLADVYITVGVIFLLASILKSQSQNPNDK
jgi:signal peptidase II